MGPTRFTGRTDGCARGLLSGGCTSSGATGAVGGECQELASFLLVARQGCGPLEIDTGLVAAAEPQQQVGPRAREQVVARERRLLRQGVDELESSSGAVCHRDGHSAVELDDQRGHQQDQRVVQGRYLGPVSLLGLASPSMAGGDGSLESIRSECRAHALRSRHRV